MFNKLKKFISRFTDMPIYIGESVTIPLTPPEPVVNRNYIPSTISKTYKIKSGYEEFVVQGIVINKGVTIFKLVNHKTGDNMTLSRESFKNLFEITSL
jgi:hypothetical protein